MPEGKLKIIRDAPTKYHFKTKDDQRVNIEHKNQQIILDLSKWGEEASLQITLDTVPTPQHTFSENKIEVENPDFLLRVYPIDTRSTGDLYGDTDDVVQCHDGGLRLELVLKKKRPAMSNSFSFPLVAKNLRFSYQPFLTEQDIADRTTCPLNAEGSYAVYHATRGNMHSSSEDAEKYKTGKAFHIFRPIAEDADGNKAWCSVHIDKYLDPTSLTITIPQQFLDGAVYPVTVDPDFGYQVIGSITTAIGLIKDNASYRIGSAWTMPAPGGTANWIKAYLAAESGDTVDCKAFINQKDSGGLGTHGQIATKENLQCAAATHWEQFNLAGEGLTEGVDYILDVAGDGSDCVSGDYYVYFDVDGATAVDSYAETQTYGAPESPWVRAAEPSKKDVSIYCNYTAAGNVGLENKSANMGSKMVAAGLI